jgi:hypothetical protein
MTHNINHALAAPDPTPPHRQNKRSWIRNNSTEKKLEQHEHCQNDHIVDEPNYGDEPTAVIEEQCDRSKKMMQRFSKRSSSHHHNNHVYILN